MFLGSSKLPHYFVVARAAYPGSMRGPDRGWSSRVDAVALADITVVTGEYDGMADLPDSWWNGVAR